MFGEGNELHDPFQDTVLFVLLFLYPGHRLDDQVVNCSFLVGGWGIGNGVGDWHGNGGGSGAGSHVGDGKRCRLTFLELFWF